MIIPIVGEILSIVSMMLNIYFKKWPMEVAGVSEVIFPVSFNTQSFFKVH